MSWAIHSSRTCQQTGVQITGVSSEEMFWIYVFYLIIWYLQIQHCVCVMSQELQQILSLSDESEQGKHLWGAVLSVKAGTGRCSVLTSRGKTFPETLFKTWVLGLEKLVDLCPDPDTYVLDKKILAVKKLTIQDIHDYIEACTHVQSLFPLENMKAWRYFALTLVW